MGKLIYWRFVIVCAILSQGIASLSDNSSTDSLNLLVRKKRIIDRSPARNRRPRLQDVPYVVNVLANGHHVCAGNILAARVILTAANCVEVVARYTVAAGTISARGGTTHLVDGILRHPLYITEWFVNNIALLSILEPIIFGPGLNHPIEIYQSRDPRLPPNTLVTTSGWGLALQSHRELVMPGEIRSVHLPTISVEECWNYHEIAEHISSQFICTRHAEKRCADGDDGNPLVYQGRLIGILSWHGNNELNSPSFFLNVALPVFRTWIIRNMHHIPAFPLVPLPPLHQHLEPERRQQRCPKIHPCPD